MAERAVAKRRGASPENQGARGLPVIEAEFCRVNEAGAVFKTLVVRLPEGAIADDLKEPGLWSRIQGNPNLSLRKHDRVYLIAYDESWAAEAIVSFASANAAILTRPQMTAFPERAKPFYSDGTYAVAWYGNGFAVRRLTDGQRVTEITTSEALAERDLGNMYPRAAV